MFIVGRRQIQYQSTGIGASGIYPKPAKINATPIRMKFADMFVKLSIFEDQATRWAFVLPRRHVLLPHVVSHVLSETDCL